MDLSSDTLAFVHAFHQLQMHAIGHQSGTPQKENGDQAANDNGAQRIEPP